jgi:tagatose 6-phosphate kinase
MISTVTLNPSIDKTIYIARLAPNDTNRVMRVEIDAGGKGINCARMLRRLGSETEAIALLGGTAGDFVSTVLAKEGIKLHVIATDRPTRNCVCVEESNGLPPTTFNERGGPIEHRELVAMLELVKDVARTSEFMLFGGSVPTGINEDVYKVLIDIAVAGGSKAVLDTDGLPLVEGLKAKPFMIKPNHDEVERLLDITFASKSDVARAALTLSERGIPLVVISLGKQGAVACYDGMVYYAVPPDVKVASSIGSGDSMIAGMLHALSSGAGIEDALKMGCAAGSATALSSGSDIGVKADVDALLDQVKVTKVQPSPISH